MASPRMIRSNGNARYHELQAFTGRTTSDADDSTYQPHRNDGSSYYSSGQDLPFGVHNTSSVVPSTQKAAPRPLGKPTMKKGFHILDILAVGLSLLCLASAIASVAHKHLSWRLGVKNHQLIVVGFLLCIMNLCLASVATNLFLLLEARFGSSTLHNYDGILRNEIFSSKLSLVWRFVLSVMLALPLGLSVAYKIFTGGESAMKVKATTYTHGVSYSHYGLFGPPGLQSFGGRTGVSLFSNATLPFAVASSPNSRIGDEPPIPTHAQAYGFNVLSLNNESTAMLDTPSTDYVSAIQGLLSSGESWKITAPVFATVATFNDSRTKDLGAFESEFNTVCESALLSSGAITHQSMMNNFPVTLIDNPSPGDQSLQYIALSPDPGIEYTPSCSNLTYYAQPYNINRQSCNSTWSITRGSIQLVDASCNNTILPSEKQQLITESLLFLGVWYMDSLVEFFGNFATTRNESEWTGRYLATGVAAMLWSRISRMTVQNSHLEISQTLLRRDSLSNEDAGIVYPRNDDVVYIRPTLRRSGLLYSVLALQPLLTVIILGLTAMFRSTPVDKGFGLVSILSGVDRGSLDILSGVALSGKLTKRVRLVIQSKRDGGKGVIEYHCAELLPTEAHTPNGKVDPKLSYH